MKDWDAVAALRQRLGVSRARRGIRRPGALAEIVGTVRHRTCQWPLWPDGEPPPDPPLFCGAPTTNGRAYCDACRLRAIEPVVDFPLVLSPLRPEPAVIQEMTMTANAQPIVSIVDRLVQLEGEKRETASAIKDVYEEAKSKGYTVAAVRLAVKRQMETSEQRAKRELVESDLELMLSALGDFANSPLGQAAVSVVA